MRPPSSSGMVTPPPASAEDPGAVRCRGGDRVAPSFLLEQPVHRPLNVVVVDLEHLPYPALVEVHLAHEHDQRPLVHDEARRHEPGGSACGTFGSRRAARGGGRRRRARSRRASPRSRGGAPRRAGEAGHPAHHARHQHELDDPAGGARSRSGAVTPSPPSPVPSLYHEQIGPMPMRSRKHAPPGWQFGGTGGGGVRPHLRPLTMLFRRPFLSCWRLGRHAPPLPSLPPPSPSWDMVTPRFDATTSAASRQAYRSYFLSVRRGPPVLDDAACAGVMVMVRQQMYDEGDMYLENPRGAPTNSQPTLE